MLGSALTVVVSLASSCLADEKVVFRCDAGEKVVAVCGAPENELSSLTYRFGPAGAPELTFPPSPAGFAPFRLQEQTTPSGTSTALSFTNGDTTHEVYSRDGKDAGGGVNVKKGGTIVATIGCTGAVVEAWEAIKGKVAAGEAGPQPPPKPLVGKSPKDICESDTLLMLQHPFAMLKAGLFKKVCCTKLALGADHPRCNLDWPYNDVPMCQDVSILRNSLFAVYGRPFKDYALRTHFAAQPWYVERADYKDAWVPKVAQQNATALKAFADQGGCMNVDPTAAAPGATLPE